MENILKTIFWTFIILTTVLVATKVLLWLLPFLIVAVIIIYFYGKYKINKFTKETSYNETYTSQNKAAEVMEDNVEVVDVEYKDVE